MVFIVEYRTERVKTFISMQLLIASTRIVSKKCAPLFAQLKSTFCTSVAHFCQSVYLRCRSYRFLNYSNLEQMDNFRIVIFCRENVRNGVIVFVCTQVSAVELFHDPNSVF